MLHVGCESGSDLRVTLVCVQNQLFTLQSDRETAAAGREEEADVSAAEVDAAQRRLAGLEAEKDALLAQVGCFYIWRHSFHTPPACASVLSGCSQLEKLSRAKQELEGSDTNHL